MARLLSQPDNATATIKGKTVSAGQVRKWLRSVAATRGKGRVAAGSRGGAAQVKGAAALQARNRTLIAELQQESRGGQKPLQQATLRDRGVRVSATSAATFGQPDAKGALQAEPCSSRPVPGLARVEGAGEGGGATPGGVLILRGRCLGTAQGQVRMYGAFPGPYVSLQISMWADNGVAAVVPADLAGVVDQVARLQVVTAQGAGSNEEKFSFVARRESLQIPIGLVQLAQCGYADDPVTDCGMATGNHFAMRGQSDDDPNFGHITGDDSWRVQVGNGWALNTLDLTKAFGTFTVQGFDQGPPDFAAFTINWDAGQSVEKTTTDCPVCVSDSTDSYVATYSIVVTASGPAGVSPDPSVKPPYSESHGPGTSGMAGSAPQKMARASGASAGSSHARTHNWNPPTGSGAAPGTGTQVGGSVRRVWTPGQPTIPAPGAPAENGP